jgi:menaquinol-cytochrome c reductase iron-sulfur subunit
MSDPATEPATATPPEPGRRGFLLTAGWGLQALAAALVAVPVVGYLLSAFRRDASALSWVRLGSVSEFPEGTTRFARYRNPARVPWDGATSEIACWVRRVGSERFQVFSVHCTHLGCPVRWFAESGLFMCPCHGGVFYENGERAAGPPPRGLYEYEHRVRGGALWIRAGRLPTLGQGLS